MNFDLLGFSLNIDLEILTKLIITTLLSLYIRFLFIHFQKLNFLKTQDKLLVFAILPATGFVITNVISNDIALSLGMVGALSIVRFRTPIKNPTELMLYFLLITLGIVTNVSVDLAITFVIFITILIFSFNFYEKLIKNNRKNTTLSEFDNTYTLNLCLKKELEKEYNNLLHFSSDEKNQYLYIYQSDNKENLKKIIDGVDKKDIVSFSID